MTPKSKYNLLLILFLMNLSSYAQKPKLYFEHLTTNEGLSSNNVQCFLEDKLGYIWVGTKDGLNKFDGYSFEVFRNSFDDTSSICNNDIRTLVSDNETGNFWVGTQKGLDYFDRDLHAFRHYKGDSILRKFSDANIFSLLLDSKGELWIGTHNSLFKFNTKKNNTVEKLPHNIGQKSSYYPILSLYEDSKQRIWIGTSQGLKLYDISKGTFSENDKLRHIDYVGDILEDENKNIWLGSRTEGVLLIKNGNINSEYVKFNAENNYLSSNKVYGIFEFKNDFILILNTDEKLVLLNKKSKKVFNYKPDHYNPNSLNSKAIRYGTISTTRNLYLGTFNSGINYIDSKRKNFEHYKFNFSDDGIFNNNIRALFQDSEGKIWVGTKENGGLSYFNRESGTFKNYNPENAKSHGLFADYIFAINEIDENNLILGTLQNGLIKFNKKTENFSRFIVDKTSPNRFIKAKFYDIKKDNNGILWIGGYEPLIRFNPITKEFKSIDEIRRTRTILIDNDTNIWVGTENGLIYYNDVTGEKKLYSSTDDATIKISHHRIRALLKDNENSIWIGTEGGGLNHLNFKTGKVKIFNENDGLANNRVAGILKDEKGNLWISTGNGLSKFNIEDSTFYNFSKSDGLQGNEFENFVCLKLNNNEMIFGGRNGFNIFQPDEIKRNDILPIIHLTNFKLFNKPVPIGKLGSPLKKHINETKEITLTHKQSVFSIEFVALNYSSPEKNLYKYKIEGFDNEWVESGSTRSATYTNLPANEYLFKVIASNNDGIWNENPKTLRINILPPWWKTIWFRFLIIFFVAGGSSSFYFLRMLRMKDIQKLLKTTVNERTKELNEANAKLLDHQEEITLQNNRIREQNNNLIASEEELRSLNEELHTKHDMLLEQKEELETTLNKLKETQKQLIHSEKMASIGILTAGIAHELNNPLNFIQSGLYAVENYFSHSNESQQKEIKPLLKSIETGINRATNIIRSMNKFSHSGESRTKKCDLGYIIESCLVLLNNEIKNRIEIVKNYTRTTYKLIGNEGKLNQVFLNILTNSCQAIENTGKINITTKVENKKILVVIEDSGVGITKNNLGKIMDPFFTTKEPGKGTGLGMSISYSIIQEHKGNIYYESVPGEGTTVTVELPTS